MYALTPSRLRLARQRRGLTLTALASAVDLHARTIRAYEHGERHPDEETVTRLAGVLSVPRAYLSNSEVDLVDVDTVSFRAMSRTTALHRDQALAAVPDAEALASWLSERYRLPESDVPDLSDIPDPEVAAEALRAHWGLGSAPSPDMINLLEHHGVRVFSLGRDFDDVDAFSLWRKGIPYVFLSMSKSGERGRMDAAHELAHLALHQNHISGRERETDAKRFASAFLLPRDDVISQVRRGATTTEILLLKDRWCVAATALAYRIYQLGLVTSWQHRTMQVQLSSLGYRSGEPGGIPNEVSGLLPALLADAAKRHGRSLTAIAADIAVPVEDLHQLIFERGGGLIFLPGGGHKVTRPPSPEGSDNRRTAIHRR